MIELRIAAKAVIVKEGKVLVISRSPQEMENREFEDIEIIDLPGGIIEAGERVEEGLHRELKEEVGLEVSIIKPLMVSDHFGSSLHIVGILFLCKYKDGEVRLSPEHDQYYWVDLEGLKEMDNCYWAISRVEHALREYKNIGGQA